MIVTAHAMQRWNERFPELDFGITFSNSGRVGRKTRAKIRASCPVNSEFASGCFKGRYYRMTRDGIIFVITPPEKIITVFRLDRLSEVK